MRKLLSLFLFSTLIFSAIITLSRSQVITTPSIFAAACAYSSSPPAVVAGKFYLVQCNTSGQIIAAPQ